MSEFRSPTAQEKTLKVLVFGKPKRGKSHFCFTATEIGPVLWQDTEHGSDYYDAKSGHGFQVAYDKSPETAIQAIKQANGEIKGNIRPVVVVDSMSSVWFAQQEVAEELTKKWGKGKDTPVFRAWGPAKKPLKVLYDSIMTSRCHVIITARAKPKYDVTSGGEPKEIGVVPDIERNLEYAVDIVLEVDRDDSGFYAIVHGSRSPKLPTGKRINNPKVSDLLVAMQPGEAPEKIKEGVQEQVTKAITSMTGAEFLAYLESRKWPVEEARRLLKEEFGPGYQDDKAPEYIKFLTGFHEKAEEKNEKDLSRDPGASPGASI